MKGEEKGCRKGKQISWQIFSIITSKKINYRHAFSLIILPLYSIDVFNSALQKHDHSNIGRKPVTGVQNTRVLWPGMSQGAPGHVLSCLPHRGVENMQKTPCERGFSKQRKLSLRDTAHGQGTAPRGLCVPQHLSGHRHSCHRQCRPQTGRENQCETPPQRKGKKR